MNDLTLFTDTELQTVSIKQLRSHIKQFNIKVLTGDKRKKSTLIAAILLSRQVAVEYATKFNSNLASFSFESVSEVNEFLAAAYIRSLIPLTSI